MAGSCLSRRSRPDQTKTKQIMALGGVKPVVGTTTQGISVPVKRPSLDHRNLVGEDVETWHLCGHTADQTTRPLPDSTGHVEGTTARGTGWEGTNG